MTTGPLIPIWLTVPTAIVLMLLISTHAASLRNTSIPPSRRRIRQANAWLSVLTLGLLTAGFSLLDPAVHTGEWMLVWIGAMSTLLMVITLAVLDVGNTMRIALISKRRIRRRVRQTFVDSTKDGTRDPKHEPS